MDKVGVFVSAFLYFRLGALGVVCMDVCVSKLLGISMGVFANVVFVRKCKAETVFEFCKR